MLRPTATWQPIEVRSLQARDPLQNPLFARELVERYLIFDACVAGQRRVDLHPLVLSPGLHQAAMSAAVGIARAVSRVAALAHEDPAERACYGLHEDVLALSAASFQSGDQAALMRVDLLLDEEGTWRACEINADCPGGQNESYGLPRLAQAAGFWECHNPTTVLSSLAMRLAELAAASGTGPDGVVALLFATAYAEDLQVCALLRREVLKLGVNAVLAPPTAPRLRDGVLHVGPDPVSVLYRFFPTEYMEGQNNLLDIAEAVGSGAVRTLSSFAHIFTQSKMSFARACKRLPTLPEAEQALLRRHLPESFDVAEVPRDQLLRDRPGWVLKRAMGRVGDEVFVGPLFEEEEWPALCDEVLRLRGRGECWIAQRFVRQRPVRTPFGDRLVTLGAYVLDGHFVGYFARITEESHVSHDALCVPVFAALTSEGQS